MRQKREQCWKLPNAEERDLEPRQIGKFFPRKPGGKAKAQGKRAVEEKMRKTRREITTIISS